MFFVFTIAMDRPTDKQTNNIRTYRFALRTIIHNLSSSQILYDDGYDGIVNGYVWQHFATLGSSWLGPLDSIWEHPNRIELETKLM